MLSSGVTNARKKTPGPPPCQAQAFSLRFRQRDLIETRRLLTRQAMAGDNIQAARKGKAINHVSWPLKAVTKAAQAANAGAPAILR